MAVRAACFRLRGSNSNRLCVTWQQEKRVMLRDSKYSVLYVTWQYEHRVTCYVAVRAVCYMLRGSKSSVL